MVKYSVRTDKTHGVVETLEEALKLFKEVQKTTNVRPVKLYKVTTRKGGFGPRIEELRRSYM